MSNYDIYEIYREMMESGRRIANSSVNRDDANIHALLAISAGLGMVAEAIREKQEITISDIPLDEFEKKFGKT